MELVCLGEILMEMVAAEPGKRLHEVSSYVPTPGGMIAHVAIAARRLGARSAFIGKVGDDAFGHHLHNVLRREGVETSGLRFDENARTTLSLHAMPDGSSPETLHYRNPGADSLLRPEELDERLLNEAQIFHFGSVSITSNPARSATQRAISLAEHNDSLITFGVNYQSSLWPDPDEARTRITALLPFVHLVIVDTTDLRLLCGTEDAEEGSRILFNYGPAACVVLGGNGYVYSHTESAEQRVDAPPEMIINGNGSRAAFTAGFLWRLLGEDDSRRAVQEGHLQSSLRYGSAACTLSAHHPAILSAFPDAPTVHKLVQEYYSPDEPRK